MENLRKWSGMGTAHETEISITGEKEKAREILFAVTVYL
jgi:hypothetical protein